MELNPEKINISETRVKINFNNKILISVEIKKILELNSKKVVSI